MKLTSLTPILNVSDVPASLGWFEALGWSRGFRLGRRERDAFKPAHFRLDPVRRRGNLLLPQRPGRAWHVDLLVPLEFEELEVVHARTAELGYEISQEPTDESWRMREFHLRHPDGHVFRISAESG